MSLTDDYIPTPDEPPTSDATSPDSAQAQTPTDTPPICDPENPVVIVRPSYAPLPQRRNQAPFIPQTNPFSKSPRPKLLARHLRLQAPSYKSHDEIKRYLCRYLPYTPHPGQREFHDAKARFKVLAAGTRFGKSAASIFEILPYLLKANTRGWIVGPTYALAEVEFRYLKTAIYMLGLAPYCRIHDGNGRRPSSIATAWGAEMRTASAMNPDKLMAEELDWVVMAEAARSHPEAWTNALRGRVTTRSGIAIFASTPKGKNHFYQLFMQSFQPENNHWSSHHFTTADNPLIPRLELDQAQLDLPPHDHKQQFLASWDADGDIVFEDFKPTDHIVQKLDSDSNLHEAEVFGAIDWGWDNPTHILKALRERNGRISIVSEYADSKLGLDQIIKILREMGLEQATRIFCDPADPGRAHHFLPYGLHCAPAPRTSVPFGLDIVRQRLRALCPDNRPMLRIDSRCAKLTDNLANYRWCQRLRYDGERVPAHSHSHGPDALRYLLTGINATRVVAVSFRHTLPAHSLRI